MRPRNFYGCLSRTSLGGFARGSMSRIPMVNRNLFALVLCCQLRTVLEKLDLAATSIVPRETTRISSELDRGSGTALLERPATAKKYVRMVSGTSWLVSNSKRNVAENLNWRDRPRLADQRLHPLKHESH